MTKKRLKEYGKIAAELRSVERQLEELSSAVYSVKSVSAAVRVSGRRRKTPASGDFSGLLVRLMDLREAYERKWDALIDLRSEIEAAIENLSPMERAIIRMKYIEDRTWEEVAAEAGYSEKQVRRIGEHGIEGLKDVQQCPENL